MQPSDGWLNPRFPPVLASTHRPSKFVTIGFFFLLRFLLMMPSAVLLIVVLVVLVLALVVHLARPFQPDRVDAFLVQADALLRSRLTWSLAGAVAASVALGVAWFGDAPGALALGACLALTPWLARQALIPDRSPCGGGEG